MRYLIIGASAAGLSAAKTLRSLDATGEILVISQDEQVVSRCMLHHYISGKRTVEQLNFVDDDFFEQNQIQWLKGQQVVKVMPDGKRVQISDGREICYDKLLIATGASPVLPPIEGLKEGKQVFVLRDLVDAEEIVKASQDCETAVVIGGGLVGVDAASSLADRGIRVTIVEMGATILPMQLDQVVAGKYEERFREHGIETLTNQCVGKVILDAEQNVSGIELVDGRKVEADLIVVATGVRPNLELVKETEIIVDRGIMVDDHQRTLLEDIYAAGDVCQSYEVFKEDVILTPIWPIAVRQGEVAGFNMAGVERSLMRSFAFRNSMSFFGLSTISYGLTEAPDADYYVEMYHSLEGYRKFIVKDGLLQGVILHGDVEGAGVFGKLVQEQIDVTEFIGLLDEVTYADFFCEDEVGQFSYDCGEN